MLLIGTVATVALYSISFAMSGNNFTILAQQDLETKKYRNMVIDLGDGVKTRAQLTLPLWVMDHFQVFFLFMGLVMRT